MTTFGQVFAVPRFRVLFAGQALPVAGDTVKMLAFSVLAAAGCACFAYNLGLQRPFVDAVPPERLGQAYGLQGTGVMTAQALGAVLAGGLAEAVPPHQAIAWTGAAGIVCALVLRATALRGFGGSGASRRAQAARAGGGVSPGS